MVKNNNVLPEAMNGSLPTTNATKDIPQNMSNEASFSSRVLSWWDTLTDFAWFIICSIGYIFQDLYYISFGYPEKELKTDIALITGGGNGLGRLLAQRLGKMGTKVVIWDINKEGIKETINMVEEEGGYCKGYVVDISRKEEVYKAADVIRNEIGDVTLLINNAGVVSGLHLLDTPDHLIERSFNVNIMAHFWTTKAFLPKMIENDRGHIATIASLAGHVGITKLIDYCASKFAAVGFDEALRLELDVLGHNNIQTTCICPFFIQATGMFDDVNARWVPTLNPNDVADRVISAIKKNEKIAVIPGYIKFLLSLKWTFPWGCIAGLLRRLVPDAAPHAIAQKPNKAAPKTNLKTTTAMPTTTDTDSNANIPVKSINPTISSVTKCVDLSNDFGESLPKTASLLVQRTPSLGERVL
ncbi:estradiol 17-beta-dehydrogenase 11 [Teleopsis dalmanni]|uniref:estradiol 17-beta-dehydrogenase 11 n=1 Tax=Teleopsis dalmanni TaxID=139649 RepID=UPI0018CEB80A|nr:estradiol 17-beta-dehydrogenase 11 [Teleopsis dalmanni]